MGWSRGFAVIFFLMTVGWCHWAVAQVPDFRSLGTTSQAAGPEVKVEVVSQHEVVVADQEFALAVVLTIVDGWHLYANPRRGEFGLDTEIIPKPVDGLQFGRVVYPSGEKYSDPVLNESNHIYEGEIVCYVPVQVTGHRSGAIPIELSLKGLLCSDTGICKPWAAEGATSVGVSDEARRAKLNRGDLFAGYVPAGPPERGGGAAAETPEGAIAADDWVTPILLAVGAGLIMNLMPCVLPIIPIIVMTLMNGCVAENGQPVRSKSVKVGLAFAGGIMIVFAALAVVMSVFKLLWGQQFQGNGFKFVLLMIVYVLSLSMFGMFEIALPSKLANMTVVRKGYLGAVGMGMLVTVLATPCGAPLLTAVLTWALSKPLAIAIAVFLIIGVGMAAPYVLLTAFPRLLNRIPKAGNWMIRLKQAIGFFMLGFAAYLVMLFPGGWHGPLLYLCLLVGFCVWLGLSVVNANSSTGKRYLARAIAVVVLIAASVSFAMAPKTDAGGSAERKWLAELETYQQQGRTVIVKFTANWCKNCAVLDKVIYKREEFREKLSQTDAVLVVADWSYDDPSIKQMIQDLGGRGQALPFAVVFPGGDAENPILLRDFYSLGDTLKALDEAARRAKQSVLTGQRRRFEKEAKGHSTKKQIKFAQRFPSAGERSGRCARASTEDTGNIEEGVS